MVFYQPIKIPLSLICWLLVQAPGNRWKGALKKGPEDKAGQSGVGALGAGRVEVAPESQKYAAGRLSSLLTYHPSDFYSYFITRSRDPIVLCVLCIVLVSSICFVYVLGLNACAMISSIDIYLALTMQKGMDAVLNKAVRISVFGSLEPVVDVDDKQVCNKDDRRRQS